MIVDNGDGTYGVSFTPLAKGVYKVSITLHGENIKESPFELRVHCVSAEQSFLRVPDSPFLFSDTSLTITTIDQDGTPLTQGGDQFTATLKVDDQVQVGLF